ncbi:AAA family ATPase [Streptomyces sp. NPDC096079]|uniref:AAA family ATPase n=1 Tax=Streptomyces sp. NPDC096079 TaxID=3155820 RepID=UPI0033326132
MTQVIDPKNLPAEFRLSDARKTPLGEAPRLLDGFLYVGVTVFYSEPGLGKSMLSGQVEEHLAWGRPLGPWLPERPVRCMVLDFEGDMRLASERSLKITPFGLLASDHDHETHTDIYYATEWPGQSFFERVTELQQRLEAARTSGHPFEYVRIDTLRLFLGSKPHGVNAYDWDAHCVRVLNKLALEYDAAFILVHHTNKGGELSGSTGVAGSATAIVQLKRNPDNDDECVLLSHKVRVDAPFRYAVAMDDRGRWMFTEAITPTQAELGGVKRRVVDILTRSGPQAVAELRDALPETSPNTLKSALRRLSHENIAVYRRGAWTLTQATVAEHPKCHECGTPMEVYAPGQTEHPTCGPSPFEQEAVERFLGIPAQAPAPEAEAPAPAPVAEDQGEENGQEDEDDEHPETARFPSLAELRASVDASRMKPVKVVTKVARDSKPWTLVAERLDGHFRSKNWAGEMPEDAAGVVVLDRNGSYMSAMSSVPVAPNALVHTGALGADPLARRHLAGLFQIVVPEWDPEVRHNAGIPHPLGRTVDGIAPGELAWVVGPHIHFLDKLAAEGRLKVVDVVDSWTGRRNDTLFERFARYARTLREQTATMDPDTRLAAKQSMSRAVRSLHPKRAKSPFWRPDWHKAVLAEASVRHWRTADRAVEGGATLLSIGNVDEVAFALPQDVETPKLWVPTPYRLGAGFGQVKHKEVPVGGEKIMSPLTVEQWQNRGTRRGSEG